MLQANTDVEEGQEAKYSLGAQLVFIGWSNEEIAGSSFRCGDIVTPVERNGCGMGIDVIRSLDGLVDMVWPEEVLLLGDQELSRVRRLAKKLRRARSRNPRPNNTIRGDS